MKKFIYLGFAIMMAVSMTNTTLLYASNQNSGESLVDRNSCILKAKAICPSGYGQPPDCFHYELDEHGNLVSVRDEPACPFDYTLDPSHEFCYRVNPECQMQVAPIR